MSEPVIPADKVMSVEEAIERVNQIGTSRAGKQWHWMGNFGDPHDSAAAANGGGIGAGEIITSVMPSGLVPTWMYF